MCRGTQLCPIVKDEFRNPFNFRGWGPNFEVGTVYKINADYTIPLSFSMDLPCSITFDDDWNPFDLLTRLRRERELREGDYRDWKTILFGPRD